MFWLLTLPSRIVFGLLGVVFDLLLLPFRLIGFVLKSAFAVLVFVTIVGIGIAVLAVALGIGVPL